MIIHILLPKFAQEKKTQKFAQKSPPTPFPPLHTHKIKWTLPNWGNQTDTVFSFFDKYNFTKCPVRTKQIKLFSYTGLSKQAGGRRSSAGYFSHDNKYMSAN